MAFKPALVLFCFLSLSARALAAEDEFEQLLKLQQQVQLQRTIGQYAAAEATGKEMVALAERSFQNDPDVLATCLDQLATVYVLQELYEKAVPLCRRSIAIREKAFGKDATDLMFPLGVIADSFRKQGKGSEAEPLYRRVIALCEKATAAGQSPPNYLSNLLSLASIYDDQGRYADAEPLLRRALALAEQTAGTQSVPYAFVLNNLGKLCTDQARYAEAEKYFQQTLKIKQQLYGANHIEIATGLNNLGLLYDRQGKTAEAEPLYLEALKISEKALAGDAVKLDGVADSRAEVFRSALLNLGNLYLEQGKFAQAEPYYQRVLALEEKTLGKDNPAIAVTLGNLAILDEKQQKFREAEALFDRAIGLSRNAAANPRHVASMLVARSVVYWLTDRRDKAVGDLREALDAAEISRANFSGGELERAQATIQNFGNAFELMVGCQRDLGDIAEAFATVERWRARTLVDQIKLQGVDLLAGIPVGTAAELKRRDAEAAAKLAAAEEALERFVAGSDLSAESKAKEQLRLTQALQAAQNEAVESYRAIRNASPAYRLTVGSDFKPIALAQLHDWVKEQKGLLLEYLVGSQHNYIFVVPSDGEPQLLMMPELPADVAKELGTDPGWLNEKRLREALLFDGQPLSEVLKRPEARSGEVAAAIEQRNWMLWQLLVPEECRSKLVNGTYRRLIIVPDGPLANVPFDTLAVERGTKDGKETKYLLDVGPPIVTGPSATLLFNLSHRQQETQATSKVLSVGDPVYREPTSSQPSAARERFSAARSALKPLPFTAWETAWVADQFQPIGMTTDRLTRSDATEAAVRTQLAGHSIVHLACHGLADQTYGNLFGALALTPGARAATNPNDDGFLTLAEIYGLDIKGCELAILSACETNIGPQQQGEGVFALSRGFLVAGAQRVVASNWIVDDESSASLVSAFCSVLAKHRKAERALDHAEALQEAKRWVRKQSKWQHPYYWGAFVLIGPG